MLPSRNNHSFSMCRSHSHSHSHSLTPSKVSWASSKTFMTVRGHLKSTTLVWTNNDFTIIFRKLLTDNKRFINAHLTKRKLTKVKKNALQGNLRGLNSTSMKVSLLRNSLHSAKSSIRLRCRRRKHAETSSKCLKNRYRNERLRSRIAILSVSTRDC